MENLFCESCGHPLEKDALFCPECGTKNEPLQPSIQPPLPQTSPTPAPPSLDPIPLPPPLPQPPTPAPLVPPPPPLVLPTPPPILPSPALPTPPPPAPSVPAPVFPSPVFPPPPTPPTPPPVPSAPRVLSCFLLALATILIAICAILIGGGIVWYLIQLKSSPAPTSSTRPPQSENIFADIAPDPILPEISTPLLPEPTPAKKTSIQAKVKLTSPEATEDYIASQAWFQSLSSSQPRGVSLSLFAYDDQEEPDSFMVEIRENHSPGSGYDPNVSPRIGIFLVNKNSRAIRYLEPISGDFVPLDVFLNEQKINRKSSTPPPQTNPAASTQKKPSLPPQSPVPGEPNNQAYPISSSSPLSLPLSLSPRSNAAEVSLQIKQPPNPSAPKSAWTEKITLKVTLSLQNQQKLERSTSFIPPQQWTPLSFVFYDLDSPIASVSFQISKNLSPLFLDNISLTQAQP